MTRTGGCLCRAVRYECAGEPQFALQCHCRDCRLAERRAACRGGAHAVGRFRITHGTPKRYIAKANSGNEITRVFCGDCGTPLYVQVSTRPDIVGVESTRPTMRAGSGPKPTSSSRARSRGITRTLPCRQFATYPTGKSY